MELWNVYKMIKQRSTRNPDDCAMAEMTSICGLMFRSRQNARSLIVAINRIINLEVRLAPQLKRYGQTMKAAVRSGNYSLEVPYVVAHLIKEAPKNYGDIYVLSAIGKPGQVKIGATTMSLSKRCYMYETKDGYPVQIEKSMRVATPFKLEKAVQKLAILSRVRGNANGDSIEPALFTEIGLWRLRAPESAVNSSC